MKEASDDLQAARPVSLLPPEVVPAVVPQRGVTDANLRRERDSADEAGDARLLEEDADRVLGLARERADAVLAEARAKADQERGRRHTSPAVHQERSDADDQLDEERAAADLIVRRERVDSARVLSALVPLARKSTDRSLLTERASADAALSSRDDFLGMVSHDLNNLLAAIVLNANALERRAHAIGAPGTPEGNRTAAGLDRILLCAARMKRLIGDLVDVTSLTAGKLAVTLAANDERGLIAEALETFRELAAEKGISLESDVSGLPPSLQCDHGRILQVLANLVGNAIKFTPAGGHVTLRATHLGTDVRFSVVDDGPGIPAELLEAVFERFWQAGADDRRGLGLGLYIAKSIVEAHQGQIWVESRSGGGSAFHFTIPCLAAA